MSYRLYQEKKNNISLREKISVREAADKYSLTRREETILRALMEGKDTVTVCEELVIAENTLKKHILNLYRKMGINNRVSLFKMVREKE